MIRALRIALESRTPRERGAAVVIAVLLGIALYVVCVLALERARTGMRANVAALQARAGALDRNAAEIERLRASGVAKPAPPPQGELRALVDAGVRGAGFNPAQIRVDARGPDEVQVVVTSAPFAAWLEWVASLQAQGVRLDSGRIEALSTPGWVSATATFVRPAAR